jgi:mannan endo-1,4-beta-mannosidase
MGVITRWKVGACCWVVFAAGCGLAGETGEPLTPDAGDGCTPLCGDKVCGSDGCGGVCGVCASGTCDASGRCSASCTPSCAGKACGNDGCGGSCGGCASGTCNASGQCVPPGPSGSTMKVQGRFLYDSLGEQVVLRGVNTMVVWTDNAGTPHDGLPVFTEIAKTGANAVRIVWEVGASLSELDAAITNAIASKMIPIIEMHDYTGDWGASVFDSLTGYWTRADVVALVNKHSKFLLVNYGNEVGGAGVDEAEFHDYYQGAVSAMRAAGIHTPIVIDAPNWGQLINVVQAQGPDLIAKDPDHNLIFSVHTYWEEYTEQRIAQEFQESVTLGLPMIVGEFTHRAVGCGDPIAYLRIIEECQKQQIGWLAWSWDVGNQDCAEFDMIKSWSYDGLWGWGKEVAVTDKNSIKNTSVRPKSIAP